MIRRSPIVVVGIALTMTTLAGCSTSTTGNASPTSNAASANPSTSNAPANGAPTVSNPLPAKVLAGNPCDTALTNSDLGEFLGGSDTPKPSTDPTGAVCNWNSTTGSGAHIGVTYQTTAGGGLSLDYKNVKPTADYWTDLGLIQGYPAVGYRSAGAGADNKSFCQIVVGISDDLVYSVTISLGASGTAKGTEACTAGKSVADRVMTNIKTRA